MLVNIFCVLFIAAWVGLVAFFKWKRHKRAKETGVSECCCGCSSYKASSCNCGEKK